jgi:transposase
MSFFFCLIPKCPSCARLLAAGSRGPGQASSMLGMPEDMTTRRPYPSDLSDARWALVEPALPAWRQRERRAGLRIGRPPRHDLRSVLDAILYVDRTGVPWRYLPHEYPPWQTVYYYYYARWQKDGVFEQLSGLLRRLTRIAAGRDLEPTACVIDSQSVKTAVTVPAATQGYDAVYTRDWTGTPGRLYHIAFATDTRADIIRAADLALDHGVFIETGPHKHAIQQTFFLYVYEPGGNRIELCNAGARLILAADWQPVNWTEAERAKGQAWGLKTIESFHTHGTPPVPEEPR